MYNTKSLPLSYSELTKAGTGTGAQMNDVRIVEQPFGNFIVKIAVSSSNAYLGIVEISSHSDFRSPTQRLQPQNFHDVDSFYREKQP